MPIASVAAPQVSSAPKTPAAVKQATAPAPPLPPRRPRALFEILYTVQYSTEFCCHEKSIEVAAKTSLAANLYRQ